MDVALLPEPMRRLWHSLEARGYTLTADVYDDKAFGNRYADLSKDGFTVRFVLDRGQWRLDLGRPHAWFAPFVWHDYFAGRPGVPLAPTLEDECAYVEDNLDRIELEAASAVNVWQRLRAVSIEQYAARRQFGR